MNSDLVFLFSSEMESPDQFFQGYLFHDADYVFGANGFNAFRQARDLERVSREDGCYVHAEKRAGGYYRFSTDYHGYKKLFYFWDSGFWVVSNSVYRIAEHLRKHGYRVRPDSAQLAAMATEGTFYPSGRGTFFSQLSCYNTIIQGVQLVPADCALLIGRSGVSIEKATKEFGATSYEDQLSRYIGMWIARLETLRSESAIQVSCDLTGGLDSRAVTALLLKSIRSHRPSGVQRLQIVSGTGQTTGRDHELADKICKRFGLALNARLNKRQIWLKGRTSYALWRDLCLGVYHPIYFPNTLPTGTTVQFGGGGGENHRPFYGQFPGAPSGESFIARRTSNILPRSARKSFSVALQRTLDSIMDESSIGYTDSLTAHYRHFRNRFHAGREPQYTVKFQPLASKMMDSVAIAAGEARFRDAQIHYDLLHNLQPELLDIPFDSIGKRPGRRVRRNLTSITPPVLSAGTCFVDNACPSSEHARKGTESERAVDRLYEEFRQAKGFSANFLGAAYVRRAERAFPAALENGYFPSTASSKRVAVVIACTMLRS